MHVYDGVRVYMWIYTRHACVCVCASVYVDIHTSKLLIEHYM